MASLPPDYTLRRVDRFPEPAFNALFQRVLISDSGMMRPLDRLPEAQREAILKKRAEQGPRPFELRLGIWHHDTLVAWTFAYGSRGRALMMATSGVEAHHRRQGLYTALLEAVVGHARAAGFSEVESLHSCSNRPILIAKLKAGFSVAGVQLDIDIGLLTRLLLPLYPEVQDAFDVRTGWRPPSRAVLETWALPELSEA